MTSDMHVFPPAGWTVDTLGRHLQQQINDLEKLLSERYATQTKALDAALLAQQASTREAQVAQQTAMHTALASAEKAVDKAAAATDKRFESSNGYREQLANQAATFLSRNEFDARLLSNIDKMDSNFIQNGSRIQDLENRLNTMQGQEQGAAESRNSGRLDVGTIVAVLAVIIAAAAMLIK